MLFRSRSYRPGWAMAAFEYRQAQEIRDVLGRHGVSYLFIGKSGAILLGYPDTTQDADLFLKRSEANCDALLRALAELGFVLTEAQGSEVKRGKDFIQLKNGPFDLDLVFAPDESRGSRTPGPGMSKLRGFRSAISTTSLPARRRPTGREIGSHCPA